MLWICMQKKHYSCIIYLGYLVSVTFFRDIFANSMNMISLGLSLDDSSIIFFLYIESYVVGRE